MFLSVTSGRENIHEPFCSWLRRIFCFYLFFWGWRCSVTGEHVQGWVLQQHFCRIRWWFDSDLSEKKKPHGTRNLSIDWKVFCIGWRLLICAEARSMIRVLYCLQYFKFPSCKAAARQPTMQHFSGGGSQNVGMSQFLTTDTHWHLLLWFLKDFKTQWILLCYSNGTKHGQPFLPRVQDMEIFAGSWKFYALILCVLTLF